MKNKQLDHFEEEITIQLPFPPDLQLFREMKRRKKEIHLSCLLLASLGSSRGRQQPVHFFHNNLSTIIIISRWSRLCSLFVDLFVCRVCGAPIWHPSRSVRRPLQVLFFSSSSSSSEETLHTSQPRKRNLNFKARRDSHSSISLIYWLAPPFAVAPSLFADELPFYWSSVDVFITTTSILARPDCQFIVFFSVSSSFVTLSHLTNQ